MSARHKPQRSEKKGLGIGCSRAFMRCMGEGIFGQAGYDVRDGFDAGFYRTTERICSKALFL